MKLGIEEESDKIVCAILDGTWEGLRETKSPKGEGNDEPTAAFTSKPKRFFSQKQVGLDKSFFTSKKRKTRGWASYPLVVKG